MVKSKSKEVKATQKPVIKTGIVLEGIDMYNYRGIDAIKESGVTYRTASEAFKDANYATAGWRCKPDWLQAVEWFSELFMCFFWFGCAIAFPIIFILWLFR